MTAITVRPRATVALVLASCAGLVAYGWPLLADASWTLEQSRNAPVYFGGLLLIVLAVVLAELSDEGIDARAVAMLGVLSAMGAAVRPLGAGTAGIETVFFLLIIAGRVFGPGFGFVLGNTALFASAILTGGVGPWLPYQMLALLAAYSAVAALVYGLALNLSFWPFALGTDTDVSFQAGDAVIDNLTRLVVFSLTTSLGWDIGRAVTTALLVVLAGPVLLRTFRRAARRARFDRPAASTPSPPATPATPALPRDRPAREIGAIQPDSPVCPTPVVSSSD